MSDCHARMQPMEEFIEQVALPDFPCVGAKSALAQDQLSFVTASDLRRAGDDRRIVRELQAFAHRAAGDAVFLSMIVLFPDTPELDESGFELALWQRLQAFHLLDLADFDWDPTVSPNPNSPQFSMSIGGRGFYVIGLHPGSSRAARRFGCAALAFNLHSQFEALRADGRYDKLRDAITGRDIAYSGSCNPMLTAHGVDSEASQYSGKMVGPDWRCPFSAKAAGAADGP